MSLFFADSFDHYDTAGLALKYDIAPGGATISVGGARTGTRRLAVLNAAGPTKNLPNLQNMIVGFAANTNGGAGEFIQFFNGATRNFRIRVTAAGAITLQTGNDPFPFTIATSANGLISAGTWNYIECSFRVSATDGYAIVRLNGQTVLTYSGFTSGTASCNAFQFGGLGGGITWFYDDLYLLNQAVAPNDTFLGPVQIHACMPNADGSPVDWTPSAGQNFQTVDEVPQSQADHNQTTNVGDIDQYLHNTSGIPGPQIVYAVQHTMLLGLDIAGAQSVDSNLDGTPAGNPTALTTSARFKTQPYDTLNGSGWTLVNIATAELGPEVV